MQGQWPVAIAVCGIMRTPPYLLLPPPPALYSGSVLELLMSGVGWSGGDSDGSQRKNNAFT